MSNKWYLPTVDEHGRPVVLKMMVIGERGGWRMLHQIGAPYKGEGEIVVHVRHIMRDWFPAWMKAKSMARFRRQRNIV